MPSRTKVIILSAVYSLLFSSCRHADSISRTNSDQIVATSDQAIDEDSHPFSDTNVILVLKKYILSMKRPNDKYENGSPARALVANHIVRIEERLKDGTLLAKEESTENRHSTSRKDAYMNGLVMILAAPSLNALVDRSAAIRSEIWTLDYASKPQEADETDPFLPGVAYVPDPQLVKLNREKIKTLRSELTKIPSEEHAAIRKLFQDNRRHLPSTYRISENGGRSTLKSESDAFKNQNDLLAFLQEHLDMRPPQETLMERALRERQLQKQLQDIQNSP